MKRTRSRETLDTESRKCIKTEEAVIDSEFIAQCEEKFNEYTENKIIRNSVNSIGSMLSTVNSERVNEISHIFMNSIKRHDIKATNQGNSGRCWLFAALNIFRHILVKAANLKNFEFSQTYLYFWDKFERSNYYINWFIENEVEDLEDRRFQSFLTSTMGDGGWWNYSANLIQKYGLIPKDAMKETWQSCDSEDMNNILEEQLRNAAKYIMEHKHLPEKKLHTYRKKVMENIYSILVKFLGTPPETFDWAHTDDDDISDINTGFTPHLFKEMVIPGIDINDFIVLGNMPNYEYNKVYEIKDSTNMIEGAPARVLNMSLKEMKKFVVKSIKRKMPVWFAADVMKDFNYYLSALDDKLFDDKDVFDRPSDFSKKDRLDYRNVMSTHAMVFTGVNLEKFEISSSWQVENSWGYWDNEIPGEDGFLFMSDSWFDKYVTEVVIHKNFLSRAVRKMLEKEPIVVDPWSCFAQSTKVRGMKAPESFKRMIRTKRL